MITPTMNKVEINKELWSLLERSALVQACSLKFKKACRKFPKGRVTMTKRFFFKETNQTYIMSYFQDRGAAGTLLLAEVDHGRQMWYYLASEDLSDTTDIYSAHFFKRFAERTGREFAMPEIMTQFFIENQDLVQIYESEDSLQNAYASRKGIMLCRWDKERGLTKFCTYVPRDMLKPTQEQALCTILSEIERIETIRKDHKPFFKLTQEDIVRNHRDTIEWADSTSKASEIACAIYKQYFEDGEE